MLLWLYLQTTGGSVEVENGIKTGPLLALKHLPNTKTKSLQVVPGSRTFTDEQTFASKINERSMR